MSKEDAGIVKWPQELLLFVQSHDDFVLIKFYQSAVVSANEKPFVGHCSVDVESLTSELSQNRFTSRRVAATSEHEPHEIWLQVDGDDASLKAGFMFMLRDKTQVRE
eukprot:c19482_g1_i1.p1 GENE.c19482_g1_i1~~c19482_g1_i1.p1  ORF type:complete len:107 (+),score=23.75 c19482_g1_i1:388-708(+)